MPNNKEEFLSQSEVFGIELKNLSNDVTANDRIAAMKAFGIKSKSTISFYLNGNVQDNDTAAKLIKFFKQKIKNRNKVLA